MHGSGQAAGVDAPISHDGGETGENANTGRRVSSNDLEAAEDEAASTIRSSMRHARAEESFQLQMLAKTDQVDVLCGGGTQGRQRSAQAVERGGSTALRCFGWLVEEAAGANGTLGCWCIAAAMRCNTMSQQLAEGSHRADIVCLAAECSRLVLAGCVAPQLAEPLAVLAVVANAVRGSGALHACVVGDADGEEIEAMEDLLEYLLAACNSATRDQKSKGLGPPGSIELAQACRALVSEPVPEPRVSYP